MRMRYWTLLLILSRKRNAKKKLEHAHPSQGASQMSINHRNKTVRYRAQGKAQLTIHKRRLWIRRSIIQIKSRNLTSTDYHKKANSLTSAKLLSIRRNRKEVKLLRMASRSLWMMGPSLISIGWKSRCSRAIMRTTKWITTHLLRIRG